MAYGITSESQLIDIETIRNGCLTYIESLNNFTEAGKKICDAGTICDKKALEVYEESMQPVLYELGVAIAEMGNVYAEAANNLYSQAITVYNEQVAELNEYYRNKTESTEA